ncbi:MAG: HEPN domain-containing protein [bacterium]|nr:HEPN domain-containing protein [bacterium]
MSTLEQEILRKVLQWLSCADDDLHLAQHGLKLKSSCPYRLIAYHSQQCVEKYLKAYLVFRGIDFPYTHNISLLLELCEEQVSWVEKIPEAEELSRYAITTRYPGIDKQVTKEEAYHSINIATHVREVVRTALIQEGVNL